MLAAIGLWTLFATAARAQHNAGSGASLADRLGLTPPASESQAASRTIHDSNVVPAGAAADNRPRAPREAATAPPKRKPSSGGGLFSGLHMPSLFSGSSHQDQLSNPPAAYDSSEGSASGTSSQARTQPRTQSQSQSQTQSPSTASAHPPVRRQTGSAATTQQRATGGAAPRTSTSGTTAGTRAPSTTTVAPAPPATSTPRVVRSSPKTDNRHNELADALTGLRDNAAAEESTSVRAHEPATNELSADSGVEVTPPAAEGDEAAPSYLNEDSEGSATASRSPARNGATSGAASSTSRGWSRGPVDVRDALLGDDSSASSAPAPAPRAVATASPSNTLPTAPATTPAKKPAAGATARRTTSQLSSPVRRSPPQTPAVEADAAAQLQGAPSADNPGEALGGISAERTPPAYETTPTETVVAGPTTTPTRISPPPVRSSSVVPPVKGIGNLRTKSADVLLSCKAPVIVSSVSGPQRIVVGRTAEYKVLLENKGDEPARDMIATISIPAGADVQDAAASNGAVDQPAPAVAGDPHTIQWRLYELAAGASQTLTVQLVPRNGHSLQLHVKCEQAPATAEATVEVQEPQAADGDHRPGRGDCSASRSGTRSRLSNPGTGNADDVAIELVPPGGDPKAPVKHKVGALAAGRHEVD